MKKLNRKGFTLIELLAVIVILAIVLVVTIPSVIDSMNKAKGSQLQNAADTATEWFTKQYELATFGSDMVGTPNVTYTDFINSLTDKKLPTSIPASDNLTSDVLKAAGITNTDGMKGKIYLKSSKICIELTVVDGSQFYNNSDTTKNSVSGSGC